jgi:anti-sigma-K factor RskA
MNAEQQERLLDLLTERALFGLSSEQQRELAALQAEAGTRDDESLEFAAAAINIASIEAAEMPASLRSRIIHSADEHFASAFEEDLQPTFEFEPKRSSWNWLGWLVAAAACVALAVNIYLTRQTPQNVAVQSPTPIPSPERPDPRREFETMLASADAVKAQFAAMPKAPAELANVSGDVVWSDARQAGYMRLRGVPKNDASKSTYQLWIFDETQDEKTPIDGGTFDINADGEVIVPIDAKLTARNPKAFAITIEKPGGVVVSDRKRIVTLGAVPKSES